MIRARRNSRDLLARVDMCQSAPILGIQRPAVSPLSIFTAPERENLAFFGEGHCMAVATDKFGNPCVGQLGYGPQSPVGVCCCATLPGLIAAGAERPSRVH